MIVSLIPIPCSTNNRMFGLASKGISFMVANYSRISILLPSKSFIKKSRFHFNKSKIGLLRNAIQEGFSQASEKLGGLPRVSLTTYDLVIEKLDAWEKEE